MKNIKPLSNILKQRNRDVSRLEQVSLKLKKELVKKRGEAFGRLKGELSRAKEKEGGGGALNGLLGLGGAAAGGGLLRSLRSRFTKPKLPKGGKPANKIVPTKGLRGGGKPSLRGGLRMGKFNAVATTALTGVDYGLRLSEGQTQTQAVSGALSTTAGGLAGFAAGAKGGALLGGTIGAFFGGAGAIPGAAIGGFLGGVAGSFGGATLGAGISDKITGADQRRKVEEKTQRISQVKTKFGGAIQEFDSALDRFDLLARKKIFFIDDDYIINLNKDDDDDFFDPLNPFGGPRPQGPQPTPDDLEPSTSPFEADLDGKAEKHSGESKQFRYSPDYVPTGVDYSEIPSTPSNKVVPTEQLPVLVRPHVEKFDIENNEEQTIDTPYGKLIRKPATAFAPAGFVFLNRDRQEDKRFRTQQTIESAPVQGFGLFSTALTMAGLARGSRGAASRTVKPAVKPKTTAVPPPPRSVRKITKRYAPKTDTPKTRTEKSVLERIFARDANQSAPEITPPKSVISKGPTNAKDMSSYEPFFTNNPSNSSFGAMILPLLGAGMLLGGEGNSEEQSMPFAPLSSPSGSISMPESPLPYSKYLEYESYMKVWK